MKGVRITGIVAVVLGVMLIFTSISASVVGLHLSITANVSGNYFDHVVIVVMENEGLYDICNGNPPPCNGANTPYLSSLANAYGINQNYASLNNTSFPNYETLIAGNNVFPTCNAGGCNNLISTPNLIDTLTGKGLTWKGYFENQPIAQGCAAVYGVPPYNILHNPFIWFSDIANSPTRCNQLVLSNPSSCGAVLDCVLINDLNSVNAPNFMWVTPNDCNNMHAASNCANGCTSSGLVPCLTAGDNYMKTLVPSILNSYTFSNTRSALFVVFDEGNGYCPLGGSSRDCVYALWAGPNTKTHYSSAIAYNHYSFLSTVNLNWGLTPIAKDGTAPNMAEFLTSQTGPQTTVAFNWTPSVPIAGTSTSFTASVTNPPSGTLTYTWRFGDGVQNTALSVSIAHTYANAGSYNVTIFVNVNITKVVATQTSLVVVASPTPTLVTVFNFSPTNPTIGQSISFVASVSGGVPPYSFTWNYGDGGGDLGQSVIHSYSTAGVYTVIVSVSDSAIPTPQVASSQQSITVTGIQPPKLAITIAWAPNTPLTNQQVNFAAVVTGGVQPYTISWTFGDNTGSLLGVVPTHAYASAGNYLVIATVTDNSANTATTSSTISVQNNSCPTPQNCTPGGGGNNLLFALIAYLIMNPILTIGVASLIAGSIMIAKPE